MTYLLSGEIATVHKSTGPKVIFCLRVPVSVSCKHNVESRDELAMMLPSLDTSTDTTPKE